MTFLRYAVRVDAPEQHVAAIELTFPVDGDRSSVTMPAWSPGSYRIRDYARFVRDLAAFADDGTRRAVTKTDKTTWSIDAAGAKELTVRYTIYGHDLTVRTNHIDPTHAFLHGPATFLYPPHLRDAPCAVTVTPPSGWTTTTAMGATAANIDELFDHPIHTGISRTLVVPAKLPVTLSIWGDRAPGGVFDEERLCADLGAIVDNHVARFGEAPFANYKFMLMLAHDAYGGLEHRASSVNLYTPHFGATRKSYEGLLELLSHELFHAWNGKRIAPRSLHEFEFDYAREAYTPCLWVMEGITSHYDRFALRSASRITAKSYLEKVLDDWARLQATPGRARQSLEQSSFDAWIKLYKPDESNLNTTVSYYLKGGLVMFALDLHIRRRTDGARSLDDVLRALWQRYGSAPHPDNLQPLFEEATGLALADVFDNQIRGTADPDLASELSHVGLVLRATHDPAQLADGANAVWLGVTTSGTKVTTVFDGGPAHAAGISPGDELIALDGFRAASESDLRSLAAARRAGDKVLVHAFRRHRLVELCAVIGHAPPTRYEIAGIAEPGAAAARYHAWLGEPHPGAQILATITTTNRWV